MVEHNAITQKKANFKYSIIVAIFNVADYIEEMANSIINQTIGFNDKIQLILVNDGSSDNSEEICKKLQQSYPDNIIYIYQDNSGVSAARNTGLKYATGEYVNFLDGDDLLELDAIEKVDDFFSENKNEVDLAAIRLQIFGREGIHPLDYKFKSTRIVDIEIDYKDIQLSSSSSFIKKSALADLQFDEKMKYAEDAKLLSQVILKKKKYGIVHDAIYHYRKREDGSSATQSGEKDKDWYHNYVDTFSISLIDYSLSKLGYVPEYIQYLIMYDLQWRVNVRNPGNVLSDEEINSFIDKLQDILQHIDVHIIYDMKHLNIHRKNYLYCLKEKKSFVDTFKTRIYRNDVILTNPKNRIVSKLSKQNITIEFIYEEFGELVIEGNIGSQFASSQFDLVAELDGEFIELEEVDRTNHNIYSLNRLVKEYKGFKLKVPVDVLSNGSTIQFYTKYSNTLLPMKLGFAKYARLSSKNKIYYTVLKTQILQYKQGKLFLYKNTKKTVIKKELGLLYRGIKNQRFSLKVIAYRLLWLFFYLFKNKSVWLLMDRQDKADDNAEHLFKYLLKINDDTIKPIFVITKDSPDYSRMKQLGKVVGYRSFKHKLYFLLSDKIISSHCDEWVINPLFSKKAAYSNLYNYDFIFLQHGIVKEDLSNWLNKYRRNLRRIVSSSELEANAFLDYNYNYNSTDIILSGLPRFDNLTQEGQKKKQILIIPSWRKHLVKPKDQLLAERPYNPLFKKSEYFEHYNSILNDERLLSEAQRLGYTIMFVPHPDMMVQLDDFDKNEYVKYTDYKTSYQTYFKESDLMLTDYSSVFFDFAYMKKPVIYFQYDQNEYHYEKGYFDYETMAFGEVITDREKVIDLMIYYMNHDCQMKDKYIDRVDTFFKYNDHNNCKRVYDSIKAIDKPLNKA